MKLCVITLTILLGTAPSFAQSCTHSSDGRSPVFFVSGVLKKLATTQASPSAETSAEIKLVHAVIPAATETDAIVVFYRAAMKEYAGYEMASVLASLESAITCETPARYVLL